MRNGWPQLLSWSKEILYSKKIVPKIKHRSQSFFMICYFKKILEYLLIFATVCNFSVYKLIGNPQKFTRVFVFLSPQPWAWSPALNLYFPAPVLNVFLPSLTLNLCFPILCFIIEVCYNYSVYFTYFLSIIWQINKLFESFHKRYFRFSQLASTDHLLLFVFRNSINATLLFWNGFY